VLCGSHLQCFLSLSLANLRLHTTSESVRMHTKPADNRLQEKGVDMDITRNSLSTAADKFADKENRKGRWEIWAKYDIRPRKDGQRYVLAVETDEPELPPRVDLAKALEKTNGIVAPGSPEEELMRRAIEREELRKQGWVYLPLVREPDLFLEFARLADEGILDNAPTLDELDTDKNAEAAKVWAETYGVLGLTRLESDEFGFRAASTRGGEADTVAAFAYEAWVANACLRLYEAAKAKELDMELIARYMTPRSKALYTHSPARARAWALDAVATATQERIAGNAYPALYGEVGRFTAGWSFMNLLGAMWLQMFWLLTATEEPQRCRNCDKIIAYEQPDQPMQGTKPNDRSRGYRTRRDKRFCGKKCRNQYTYLTSTKPRRQAARQS
jgi:hypothetical protein